MKKIFVFLSLLLLSTGFYGQQGVGIGTSTPHNTAILDIDSNVKGILIPRMTSADRTGISNPAEGLMVFDTDTNTFWYYTSSWNEISLSGGAFENNDGVVRNIGANTDDFVFGYTLFPPTGVNISERLFFFDESKGAFRAGRLENSDAWGESKVNNHSIAMGYNTEASGRASVSMGNATRALNKNAIALGNTSIAQGEESISIGFFNDASGNYSVALGSNTNAIGINATTTGLSTRAQGNQSFASGNDTEANGINSTSMGYKTEGNGDYSTALGWQTKANGERSTAMGVGTRAAAFGSTAIGRYNTGTGDGSIWVSTDPIFEVGIGTLSTSRENAMTILKNGTVSFKDYTFPTTDGSPNQVLQTDGSGNISWSTLTDGTDNLGNHLATQDLDLDGQRIINLDEPMLLTDAATKFYVDSQDGNIQSSIVFENIAGVVRNTGSDTDDFVVGSSELPQNGVTVSKKLFFFDASKAAFRAGDLFNSTNWAADSLGSFSFATGQNTKAKGTSAVAIGSSTMALGPGSFASGTSTKAIGNYSTSMGFFTSAEGNVSISTGQSTYAIGDNSAAFGLQSQAIGDKSIATGFASISLGENSLSTGEHTRAIYNSVALGRYNEGNGSNASWVSTDPLFEIGNGTSNANRNNVLTVLKNGTVSFDHYTFPNMDGTVNQVLQTDGSGNLSWVDPIDPSSLIIHSIEDNDGDTKIEFNDVTDKMLFTAGGNTVAKINSDSMFLDGNLRIGDTGQSRIYMGDHFIQKWSSSSFSIVNSGNNSDEFLINNQGQIGIGLSNPGESLDVMAENDFDGIRIKGSQNNDQVELKLDNNASQGREYVLRSTGQNASQGGGKLLIRDSEEGSTRIAVDSFGRVGIGRNNMDEKLHVNGLIKADGVAGTGTAPLMVNEDGVFVRGNHQKTANIEFTDFVPQLQEPIYYHMLEGVYISDGTGVILGSLSGIPDGATINTVKVYYMDNLSVVSDKIDFSIDYYDGSSGVVSVHSLGNSITGPGVKTASTFNNVNLTIDRSTYHYAFAANSQEWGPDMKVFSVEISYTE